MNILWTSPVLDVEPYSIFYVNALRELGHNVVAFDIRDYCGITVAFDYEHLNHIYSPIEHYHAESMTYLNLHNSYRFIKNLIKCNNFDVMIASGGKEFHPKFLDKIKIPKVWLYGDLGFEHTGKYLAPHYDLVLTTEEIEKYKPISNAIEFNMICAFPIHKPDPSAQKIYDVTFIGSPYKFRAIFIEELAGKINCKIHLFGKDWRLPHENIICHGEVFGAEMIKVINQSKILLHIQHPEVKAATLRFYEVLACAGYLYSNYEPHKLRTCGIAIYTDTDDLAKQIDIQFKRWDLKPFVFDYGDQWISDKMQKEFGVKKICKDMIELIKKELHL